VSIGILALSMLEHLSHIQHQLLLHLYLIAMNQIFGLIMSAYLNNQTAISSNILALLMSLQWILSGFQPLRNSNSHYFMTSA